MMSSFSLPANKPSVLFVCTANLCRSPMAAALLNEMVKQDFEAWDDWIIDSAGTWTKPGLPAPDLVLQVMLGRGFNLVSHRSRLVDANMLTQYALVLTMEQGHKEALRYEFPDQAHKIYLLSEMTGSSFSIADPLGGSVRDFELVVDNLKCWLDSGKQRIYSLAQNTGQL